MSAAISSGPDCPGGATDSLLMISPGTETLCTSWQNFSHGMIWSLICLPLLTAGVTVDEALQRIVEAANGVFATRDLDTSELCPALQMVPDNLC